MADLWYYQQGTEARGPLPLAHLRALAVAGEIGPATLVWQEELPGWVELSSLDVKTTGGQLPPPAPPPLPQRIIKPAAARPVARSRAPVYAALLVVAILGAGVLGFLGRELIGGGDRQAASIKPQERKGKAAPSRAASSPSAATAVAGPSSSPAAQPLPQEPDPAADLAPAVPTTPVPSPAPAERAAPSSPAPSSPGVATTLPSQPPAPPVKPSPPASQGAVLFQELDIQRMPKLGMLGTMTVQDLRYQILSQLKVAPPDQEGNLTCDQVVLQTKLIKSDDLSKAMFEDSLVKLQGWQFSFQLNPRRVITQWKTSPPAGAKVAAIEPPGGMGFLATSVMDDDGWKELAQLTFFVPRPDAGSQSWKQPMMHNFGPLGMWYGETTYTPQAAQNGLQQFAFVHAMEYRPPEKDSGKLPFTIEKATLKPERAGGTIEYNTQVQRVESAQEAFLVRGALSVGLLGQTAEVEVEEQQVIGLRLHERNPWEK